VATLTQLTLDADGTIDTANIEHDAGTGSPYFSHCNDAPDGLSADFVANDNGETSGTARFRLSNVNADFVSMTTLNIDVDLQAVGFSNDTCTLTARIFDADDEVTPLTDETATLGDHADGSRVQRNKTFGGLTGSKTQWDGAYIQFTWTYNKVSGPDNANLQLFGCDIDGTYSLGAITTQKTINFGAVTGMATTPVPIYVKSVTVSFPVAMVLSRVTTFARTIDVVFSTAMVVSRITGKTLSVGFVTGFGLVRKTEIGKTVSFVTAMAITKVTTYGKAISVAFVTAMAVGKTVRKEFTLGFVTGFGIARTVSVTKTVSFVTSMATTSVATFARSLSVGFVVAMSQSNQFTAGASARLRQGISRLRLGLGL